MTRLGKARRRGRYLLVLLCFLSTIGIVFAGTSMQSCRGLKIGIIDLADLAKEYHEEKREVEDLVHVDPQTGVVYLKEQKGEHMVSHEHGTHAAPWYFQQALLSSSYYTSDLDEADLIYVHHYCYYIWWLAHIHTLGKPSPEELTPGTYLVSLLRKIAEMPRFKVHNGQDFVFYDSHPGFVDGAAASEFLELNCEEFQESIHLVAEHSQKSNCRNFKQMKVFSTPYVPNSVDTVSPLSFWKQPIPEPQERDILAYSLTKCKPVLNNPGKKFRHDVVLAMQDQGPDIMVDCTDIKLRKAPGGHARFASMLSDMKRSIFCFALPGDAQSTRRLSEIFMAGCIPVFLGPPFNNAPLWPLIDYNASSVWFSIQHHQPWLPEQFQWDFGPEGYQVLPGHATYWFPEVKVPQLTLRRIGRIREVGSSLRNVSAREIQQLFSQVKKFRKLFSFDIQMDGEEPSAVDAIAALACSARATL